jgi:hypothetical protein
MIYKGHTTEFMIHLLISDLMLILQPTPDNVFPIDKEVPDVIIISDNNEPKPVVYCEEATTAPPTETTAPPTETTATETRVPPTEPTAPPTETTAPPTGTPAPPTRKCLS